MKIQNKVKKLAEAEKYAADKRAEITRDIVGIIARYNINVSQLCAAAGVGRDTYYHYTKKNALPTNIIRKFLRCDLLQKAINKQDAEPKQIEENEE